MRKLWGDEAWDDYLYWQANNKKVASKINDLICCFAVKQLSKQQMQTVLIVEYAAFRITLRGCRQQFHNRNILIRHHE